MLKSKRFKHYLQVALLCALTLFVLVQPVTTPGQTQKYHLFGTVTPGDGTTPNFANPVQYVQFFDNCVRNGTAAIQTSGYYQTNDIYDNGCNGNAVASPYGYFSEQINNIVINNNTQRDFSIYSARGWVSGSLVDAVSGAGVSNGTVWAYGKCTQYGCDNKPATISGNTYNFGGNPGYPAALSGLNVYRADGVTSGPGNWNYKFVASQSNYFSETQYRQLSSGQIIAGYNFALYPTQGNIKGQVIDGSTGLPIQTSVTIQGLQFGGSYYKTTYPTSGSYTFAGSGQPPDWGLPVDRTGENGPGSRQYIVVATATNYSDFKSQPITVTSGQSTVLNIYLYPNVNPGCSGCNGQAGAPIDLTNGNVWIQHRDYSLPGLGGGIELVRTWNSLWQNSSPIEINGMFGHSWRANFEERLNFPRSDTLKYWRGDGTSWLFHYDSIARTYTLISPPDERATLEFDSNSARYTLTLRDGTKRIFNNNGYLITLQDRNGNQTGVTYDTSNRITQVADPAGRTVTFTYPNPSTRQVQRIQDAVGTITTYTYDAYARLTRATYADNSYINFTYDAYNQITSVTDSQNKVLESHTYDGSRRGLTSERAGTVDKITVSYTTAYRTRLTDSRGNITDYDYQTIGGRRFIRAVTGSGCASCGGRGNSTFAFDGNGNRTSSTDGLGRVTTFTYDSMGNVTSRSIQLDPSTTVTWNYTYNGFGQVLTATDPLGNTTTNTYEAAGNLLSTTTPSPDGVQPGSTTNFAYDIKGQLTSVTDPRGNTTQIAYTPPGLIASTTDALSNLTSFAYDNRGNRTSVTDAQNHTTSFTYNVMNRLTQMTYPDNTTSSFAYDTRGRRTSVTDGNGRVTTYAYDDADRLTSVTDAAGSVTTYAYDTENNLTGITDALGRVTSFTYDAQGHVTRTTFPSTLYETYAYDAVGNLTSKTDRKGQTISYIYDALNRLTQKTYPDSTSVSYTYDNAGRLTQAADPTGTYQMSYDRMGRLTGTTTSYSFLTSRNFTTSYSYDAASNRLRFTDPEAGRTDYVYDTLNRLTSLTNFQNQQFTFSYDTLSRRTQLTRPNGVNTSYVYDNLSRLLSVLHQVSGATIDGASYTADAVGNRTSKTNLLNNTTENYTYDAIYQLTQVVQGLSTTESYTYDGVGNRLTSLGVSPYTYNSSNQLTATPNATYTYDNNGNTLSKTDATGATTYTWDYENRLTSVTLPGGGAVGFKYDPFGRRIQKVSASGTTNYVYDGANIVEEVDASGSVVARYTQGLGIDEPLAMLRSSATSHYNADGLGSITSLTDSGGSVVASYTYDTFGNLTGSTGTLSNAFRYTAREFDSESSLFYYRARYYDSNTGRFISEDPIQFDSGPNFYAYVENDPANLLDPKGLRIIPASKSVILPNEEVMKILECMDRCNGDADIIVTSGLRSPDANRRAGGRPASRHLRGLAADARVPGQTAEQTAAQADYCGARGISPYDPEHGGHTHLDIREKEWNGKNGKTLKARPWWRSQSDGCSCPR